MRRVLVFRPGAQKFRKLRRRTTALLIYKYVSGVRLCTPRARSTFVTEDNCKLRGIRRCYIAPTFPYIRVCWTSLWMCILSLTCSQKGRSPIFFVFLFLLVVAGRDRCELNVFVSSVHVCLGLIRCFYLWKSLWIPFV